MSQPLVDGRWFDVATEQEHKNLKACGRIVYNSLRTSRIQIGDYIGPGRYMLLSYKQRCPRNCCDDSVHNVLTSKEVAELAREQIKDLANILKEARC